MNLDVFCSCFDFRGVVAFLGWRFLVVNLLFFQNFSSCFWVIVGWASELLMANFCCNISNDSVGFRECYYFDCYIPVSFSCVVMCLPAQEFLLVHKKKPTAKAGTLTWCSGLLLSPADICRCFLIERRNMCLLALFFFTIKAMRCLQVRYRRQKIFIWGLCLCARGWHFEIWANTTRVSYFKLVGPWPKPPWRRECTGLCDLWNVSTYLKCMWNMW